MDKKIKRALRGLNAYIDDDRQKLCDRIHLLELSHKRMVCCIFDALWCVSHCKDGDPDLDKEIEKCVDRLNAELERTCL